MEDETFPPVVLDIGSCTTRVGLACWEEPRSSLVSLLADKPNPPNADVKVYFEEALQCSEANNFRSPIQRGKVLNWDDWGGYLSQTIAHGAGVLPDNHPVLISEPPMSPKANKEKIAEIMFEGLRVPFLFIGYQDVLSMYSCDRTTGLVLSSGDGVTFISPIQDGFKIADQVRRLNVVGQDLTLRVQDEMAKQGCYIKGIADLPKVRTIKEQLCHVTLDASLESAVGKTYELPDGQVVGLGEQSFKIPESMFTPSDLEAKSFPGAVYETIMKCDISIRKHLYQNIVLCGGNTLFPGFVERMDQELARLVPSSISVKTIPHENNLNAVWLGGAVLASLSTFKKLCVSRPEYDEVGSNIVHSRFQ